MMLISEPLIFQNCSWKLKINLNQNSEINEKKKTNLVSSRINELIKSHNISNSNENLFFDHKKKIIEEEEKKKKKYSYQDFLEKMKHKSTLNLVKSIKKFNDTILKIEYKEIETQKMIRNFLNEIENVIKLHVLWKDSNEIEIENTIEGLEKYITSKLYSK